MIRPHCKLATTRENAANVKICSTGGDKRPYTVLFQQTYRNLASLNRSVLLRRIKKNNKEID